MLSRLMLFLFLTNLHFPPEFSVMWKNGLKKKAMATLKMYDFTDRTTSNYNTQITQFSKNLRQLGNDIWSVNKA